MQNLDDFLIFLNEIFKTPWYHMLVAVWRKSLFHLIFLKKLRALNFRDVFWAHPVVVMHSFNIPNFNQNAWNKLKALVPEMISVFQYRYKM